MVHVINKRLVTVEFVADHKINLASATYNLIRKKASVSLFPLQAKAIYARCFY